MRRPSKHWDTFVNPNRSFRMEQELQHCQAALGLAPQPPEPGTVSHTIAKAVYVMDEKRQGGRMAKSVEEICDLPAVKQAIMHMLQSDDPVRIEAALKCLPAMIAAMCKASRPVAENDKDQSLDLSEVDE